MLQYSEILNKLTVKQKTELLASINDFESKASQGLDIPSFKAVRLEDVFAKHNSSLYELVRSFDTELVRKTVSAVIKLEESSGDRADVYICPPVKPSLMGAVPGSLSEDNLFNVRMSCAICDGVYEAGGSCVLDGFWLDEREISSLDAVPDKRFFEEVFSEPYRTLASRESVIGFCVSDERISGSYESLCSSLGGDLAEEILGKEKRKYVFINNPDQTLPAILSGSIVIGGSAVSIESAYNKYCELERAVKRGECAVYVLEDSIKHGDAVSEEKLDELILSLIDYVCSLKKDRQSIVEPASRISSEAETILGDAALNCAVLLKNEKNILPMSAKSSVAFVGCISEDSSFNEEFFKALESGFSSAGTSYSEGYEVSGERNDKLSKGALKAASEADVTLLFLTVPKGKRELPTNQRALIDVLCGGAKNLIAILNAGELFDASFAADVKGLVLSPSYGKETANALSALLLGKSSFSGRLTKTQREYPEKYFAKERFYKRSRGRKIGIFLDYKRDASAPFPFGFGMTYGKIRYTSISYDHSEGCVSLTMENKSKYNISEVAEIYTGMLSSSVVRPEEELKGFCKVTLKAGESRTVKIKDIDLRAYDKGNSRLAVERGTYRICASSSAGSPRIFCDRAVNGRTFENDGERISDYLEMRSNIKDGKYYLEDRITDMKAYKKTQRSAVLALILALALAAFGISLENVSGLIVALIGAAVFIYSMVKFKRASKQKAFYKTELARQNEANGETKRVNASSVKALFKEEFKFDENELNQKTRSGYTEEVIIEDITHKDLSLFSSFARNCGLSIGKTDSKALMAAMASSRIIFTDTVKGSQLDKLIGALADFFGGSVIGETVDRRYSSEDKLLFTTSEGGEKTASPIKDFINSAGANTEKAAFIILRGLNSANIDGFLSPYIRYFGNPHSRTTQFVLEGESIVLPPNLWFVAEYSARPETLSTYINEAATHLPLMDISECERENGVYNLNITLSAFDSLVKKTREGLEEHEELWKKLDGVENYAVKKAGYSIGNRFFIKIENYFSVFSEQTKAQRNAEDTESPIEEAAQAMDYALATSAMPALYSAVGKVNPDEIKNLYFEIEHNFGEDKNPICKQMFAQNN